MNRPPKYELREATRAEVLPLFAAHHAYKSLSASMTYCFAVWERGDPVAAYAWSPPPVGVAKAVCPEAPHGVLSLSRMVAVLRKDRGLRHISKPLRRQMKRLIDRTRWPVLVTFSDEGLGHNGFVYQCSGWTATVKNTRPVYENAAGERCSSYSNGKHGQRTLVRAGSTICQRWEARVCAPGAALAWMTLHGWRRVAIPGKTWASGRPAYTYVREPLIPGDGGQLGSGQPGPRATQQGAATPDHGESLAVGNVAEPQFGPTPDRTEHPPFHGTDRPPQRLLGDLRAKTGML